MNLSDGSFPQRVRMRLTGQVHAASCRQELSHPTAYFVPGRRESCSQPVGNPAPDRLGILFPTGREQDSQSVGSRIPDRLGTGFPAAGNKIRCRMAQLLPAGCGMHLTGEAHPHALRERAVRQVHCLMPMASRIPCISLPMPSTWSITPSFAPRTM